MAAFLMLVGSRQLGAAHAFLFPCLRVTHRHGICNKSPWDCVRVPSMYLYTPAYTASLRFAESGNPPQFNNGTFALFWLKTEEEGLRTQTVRYIDRRSHEKLLKDGELMPTLLTYCARRVPKTVHDARFFFIENADRCRGSTVRACFV